MRAEEETSNLSEEQNQDLALSDQDTNTEPTTQTEMQNTRTENPNNDQSPKNDCNLLADLKTLHKLHRADSGTQKPLDEETITALQEGFHSIYGMTLAEAVKVADEGPYSLVQEANERGNGKMRRCWWKYIRGLDLFQSLETMRLYGL